MKVRITSHAHGLVEAILVDDVDLAPYTAAAQLVLAANEPARLILELVPETIDFSGDDVEVRVRDFERADDHDPSAPPTRIARIRKLFTR